ncbi:MAG TPA: SRPBCC domain-containing protein, partial [Candidatus Kapabacteria bacterium]|nr:SRPBCC domain-containing protein [Candidatus Kapabacteria bacterium]
MENAVKRSNSVYKPETRELTITRTLNAPRELVWKVWTEPKHLAQWWGPNGFTNPVCEADVRPGGAIRIHMYHPDYPEHWVKGVFNEVVAPNKLVFTNNAHIGESNPPSLESVTTVTLEELNGGTKLTMHTIVTNIKPEMAAGLAGMEEGWNQSLDRFESAVADAEDTSDREIITMRLLNAPRELVWKVWTEPEHIAKWWGPNGFTNTIRKMDVRVGGEWLFTMHGPDGTDYPNKTVYTKVVKPERLEYTVGTGSDDDP